MRIIVLGAILFLSCLSAIASPYNKGYEEDVCREIMGIAETAMRARQSGIPLINALELNDKINSSPDDSHYHDLMYDIIKNAYSISFYHDEQYKKAIINEYATAYYLSCSEEHGL